MQDFLAGKDWSSFKKNTPNLAEWLCFDSEPLRMHPRENSVTGCSFIEVIEFFPCIIRIQLYAVRCAGETASEFMHSLQ